LCPIGGLRGHPVAAARRQAEPPRVVTRPQRAGRPHGRARRRTRAHADRTSPRIVRSRPGTMGAKRPGVGGGRGLVERSAREAGRSPIGRRSLGAGAKVAIERSGDRDLAAAVDPLPAPLEVLPAAPAGLNREEDRDLPEQGLAVGPGQHTDHAGRRAAREDDHAVDLVTPA